MSKTPRTDEREFAAMELKPSSRVVYATLARELETELAEARADAEHWKSECNALQRMVHEARAEIEAQMKEAYINGYEKGHFDTCEGNYGYIEDKAEDFLAALAAERGK